MLVVFCMRQIVIITNAGQNYFKFRFEDADLKSGECKEILKNLKETIPHGKGGRMYFPDRKEWRVHFQYWGDFLFVLAQYDLGTKYFFKLLFKQQEMFN